MRDTITILMWEQQALLPNWLSKTDWQKKDEVYWAIQGANDFLKGSEWLWKQDPFEKMAIPKYNELYSLFLFAIQDGAPHSSKDVKKIILVLVGLSVILNYTLGFLISYHVCRFLSTTFFSAIYSVGAQYHLALSS